MKIDRRDLIAKGIPFEVVTIKMWHWLVKDENGWHSNYDISSTENGMCIAGIGWTKNFSSLKKQKIEASEVDVDYLIYSTNGKDLVIAYDLMKDYDNQKKSMGKNNF